MKREDIQVGKTYRNRYKGNTTRKVLEISKDLRVPWLSSSTKPNEPVVRFLQNHEEGFLYLSSFASWAGSVVE